MELGVVEIIVIVELCIAPDGVKSVMFRAIRDSAQAVPGEGERQRQIVTHVAGDRYAEDLWAGNSSSGRELTKGCKCYRGLYCLCAIKECVGGVGSSCNISEEVEDHLYGSASLTVELRYSQGPVHYLLTL